jgi:serine/threonine protein kinase
VYPEIPGFKIVDMLGEGAMARVFLAIDEGLDRKVAIKVMSETLVHDQVFLDRFLAEAKDTAKFIHPGIVSIYATGVHGDEHYLVLEYLESGTLKDRQKARARHMRENNEEMGHLFSPRESLTVLAQLADALAYAHSKKVVHRDIKPANILFRSNGQAVLSDFGIAKSVSDKRELTQTGFAVGTPAYMSPEQKLGADIDTRSDLYSVGVVFFELLTGRKPHHAATGNFAEMRRELDAKAPKLPDDLSHLQDLLDKMLANDPDQRYQTATELLRDIEALTGTSFKGDETVIRKAIGHGPVAKSKTKIFALIAVVLLLAGALATWKLLPEPVAEVAQVDEKTAQEIVGLLGTAELFHEMQNLVYPPSSNAAELYRRILDLQPGNPDAIAGLRQIQDQVLLEIESELKSGQLIQARNQIELALHYFPDSKKLADLQQQTGQ